MKRYISLFVVFVSFSAFAQTDTVKSNTEWLSSTVKSWIKVSGEAGAYGELYNINGMTSRRPASTGRVYVRPVFTLFDNINIAFDLFLSTEGNSAKQQMDQIGLHPAWSWGQAHLGDFSHEFSRFTMSGINIRGAGIEINPGIFRLQIVGGQTQRRVESNPFESAYARYLVGVKLGIGKKDASFFDINVIRVRDDLASISRDRFMTIQQDSVQHDSGYIAKTDTIFSGITPQENLIVGTNFNFRFFNGMIQLRGEAAGSVYTKDMYSKEFEIEKMPEIVNSIYKARLSSNVDYAYNADLLFSQRGINAKVSYRLIGPGYTSLGLASMINDKKTIDGALALNLFQGLVTIQTRYSNQTDNVVKQKLFTTTRNEFAITTGVRPTRDFMLSVNFVNNNFENDITNDSLKLHNINNAYNFTGTYQLSLFNMNHIILTSYAYQVYKDKNILRQGSNVTSQNLTFNLSTLIDQNWTVSAGLQTNTVNIQNKDNSTYGLSARISNKMLSNRLNNSVSYSFNTSSVSTSNNIQFQSMYSFNQSHSVSFNLRTTIFESKGAVNYNFVENTGSLAYVFRF